MKNVPLSLYIHIPWCLRKCGYCDFYSVPMVDFPEDAYVDQLILDFKKDLVWVEGRQLKSIFIGGGTPNLLSPKNLERLLKAIREQVDCDEALEVTLEGNPFCDAEDKWMRFFDIGINRLSLGVQTFQNKLLKTLGRLHTQEEACRAIERAKAAGFKNINLDLMYGLPDQTVDLALLDLQTALHFEPTHLSWYQLTIEPNTPFFKKTLILPDEETIEKILEKGQALLEKNNFSHYEISNYAREDFECQHNLNYWTFGDYLGIGAGAHGKITDKSGAIFRTEKSRHLNTYLSGHFLHEQKEISRAELPLEFMMNALRLTGGFNFALFEERTGLSRKILQPMLEPASAKNWLTVFDERILPTLLGQRFLNECLMLFMSK